MAITLNEDFNFNSVQDAFEGASQFFYRLEKLASTAIEINSIKHGQFKDPLYREECVYYQLESIRDLAKQFESLFDNVAGNLGRETDLLLKNAEALNHGSVELLPQNSSQAVFATGQESRLENGDLPIHEIINS